MRLLISSLLVAACIAAPLPSASDSNSGDDSSSESSESVQSSAPQVLLKHVSVPVNTVQVHSVAVPTHSVRLAAPGSIVQTHHAVGTHAVALDASSLGVVRVGTPAVAVHNVGHLATHSVGTHAVAFKSAAVAVDTPAIVVAGVPTAHIATHAVGAHHTVGTHAVTLGASSLGAVRVGTPAVAVHNVGHAGHLPTYSVGTHAVALKSAAVAVGTPSVAVQNVGVSHLAPHSVAIAPAVHAVPSAVTYHSEHTVALPAKEIDVHVQHQTVHVPVEKRVHYGVENVVTGSQTTVHKPTLNAAAIKAPEVFVAKTRLAAPEVTVTHSETAVENKSPNYVHAPYDAGVVVEKAAPKFEETHVPTPVEVAQPYAVPKPYAVPVPNVVKTKSVVKPVHHIDVHSVNTENVVTPIEYADHHHVVSQPVHTVHAAQQVHAVQPVQLAHSAHAVHGVAHAALGVGHAAHAVQGVAHSAHGVAHAAHAVHGVTHSVGAVHGAAQFHSAAAPLSVVTNEIVPASVGHGFRTEGVVHGQHVHGFVQPAHAVAQGVTYTSHGNAVAGLVGTHNHVGINEIPGSHTSFNAVSAPVPVIAPVAVIDGIGEYKANF